MPTLKESLEGTARRIELMNRWRNLAVNLALEEQVEWSSEAHELAREIIELDNADGEEE